MLRLFLTFIILLLEPADALLKFPLRSTGAIPLRSRTSCERIRASQSYNSARDFVELPETGLEEHHPLRSRRFAQTFANFRLRVAEVFGAKKHDYKPRSKRRSGGDRSVSHSDVYNLWRSVNSELPLLGLSTFFLAAAALCEVVLPHFSSEAINALVASPHDKVKFMTAVKGGFGFGILAAVLTGCRAVCFGLSGTRAMTRARHAVFKGALRQDLSFFDGCESGELASRLGTDCVALGNIVSLHLNIVVRQTIQVVGGVMYMVNIHPLLALSAAFGLVTLGGFARIHGQFQRHVGERIQDSLADANAAAQQSFSLVRVVRAHASEDTELRRYDKKLTRVLDSQEAHDAGYGCYRIAVKSAQTTLTTGTLLFGYHLLGTGRITSSCLTSFVFYLNFVLSAMYDVGDQFSKIQDALGSAREVFQLSDRLPGMKVETMAIVNGKLQSDIKNDGVVFTNVTFSYPMRPEGAALENLSISIPLGKCTAIVGPSGGGKSSLLQLCQRFYDPQVGSVALFGRDVRTFGSKELAGVVAWVPQDPELLSMSVADNIRYGLKKETTGHEQVERAAIEAGADDFIRALPHGYDTMVGEGAVNLSGGQKQRLSIARALVRNPVLLLLDEPTSSLDAESEAEVQRAIDKVSRDPKRTVIIVAHRLATIKNADFIVVIESGRVAESGHHSELLKSGGLYAEMINRDSGGP